MKFKEILMKINKIYLYFFKIKKKNNHMILVKNELLNVTLFNKLLIYLYFVFHKNHLLKLFKHKSFKKIDRLVRVRFERF